MISQGASLLNLSLVVAEQDLAKAVGALHDELRNRIRAEEERLSVPVQQPLF